MPIRQINLRNNMLVGPPACLYHLPDRLPAGSFRFSPCSTRMLMTPAQTNNDQAQCLQRLVSGQPTLWINPVQADAALAQGTGETKAIGPAHMLAAEARFARFAPLLADLFPELQPSGGRIESGL